MKMTEIHVALSQAFRNGQFLAIIACMLNSTKQNHQSSFLMLNLYHEARLYLLDCTENIFAVTRTNFCRSPFQDVVEI